MLEYLGAKPDLNDADIVSVFDELPLWSSYFGACLLDKVKFKNSINILDIGCGTGFPLLEIAKRFGSSSHIYGIDPWSRAIERINMKIKTMGINNVSVIEGKAEELPFPDDYFSLIISNNGINNVQDQLRVLTECYRVSKKDVQFVFTVNLPETMIEFYNVFEEVLKEKGLNDEIEKMKNHILSKRKTVEMTAAMIRQGGFIVNDIYKDQFIMRYIDGTAMLNHYFIKMAFVESWQNIVPQEQQKEIFRSLENKLNKAAEAKGELSLTIPFACFDLRKNNELKYI